jgi:hypothetical protein
MRKNLHDRTEYVSQSRYLKVEESVCVWSPPRWLYEDDVVRMLVEGAVGHI